MKASRKRNVTVSVLLSMSILFTGLLCLVQTVQYVGIAPLSGLLWTGYPLCLGGQINVLWGQIVRSMDRLEPLGTVVKNVKFWQMPPSPASVREKGTYDARLMKTSRTGPVPLMPAASS